MSGFAASYSQAVNQFVGACAAGGLQWEFVGLNLTGPQGESLGTRMAYVGRPDCRRLLILNCGTHGVEGLAGSACMTAWMSEGLPGASDEVGVLLIHLINPWGTAWRRRQTEDNVDLNRNFIDFAAARPDNARYEQLRPVLAPPSIDGAAWPQVRRQIDEFRREQGPAALAEAVFRGQYSDPAGPGFGGHGPGWSNLTFRSILSRYATRARRVAFIDLHTGLGPFSHGTVLSTDSPGSEALGLARRWYGDDIDCLRAPERQMPYDIQGDISLAVKETLPQAQVTAVTLEFGTFDLERFMELQIRDCWLQQQGAPDTPQARQIRAALQEFFCPPVVDWERKVIARARQVLRQAVEGLQATG